MHPAASGAPTGPGLRSGRIPGRPRGACSRRASARTLIRTSPSSVARRSSSQRIFPEIRPSVRAERSLVEPDGLSGTMPRRPDDGGRSSCSRSPRRSKPRDCRRRVPEVVISPPHRVNRPLGSRGSSDRTPDGPCPPPQRWRGEAIVLRSSGHVKSSSNLRILLGWVAGALDAHPMVERRRGRGDQAGWSVRDPGPGC